jgi:hypothetical protein
MKSLRFTAPAVLWTLCSLSFAQSTVPPAAATDSQTSFSTVKSLAGEWEGTVTTDPAMQGMTDMGPVHISLRITSRGNAVVHEMQTAGTPLDATKYDHPLTMFYLDGDHLTLVHYCDAGNRPRMVARKSTNGETVEFDFVDLSGGDQNGHMHHAVLTAIDADHHTEDWTYMMPGNQPVHAHFTLHRVK